MVASTQMTGDATAVSAVKLPKTKSAARRIDLSLLERKLDALDERMSIMESRMLALEAFEVRK